MGVIAGVDSSTQSTKVELRDLDTGELVGLGRASHSPVSPPVSEQDPQEWWRAFNDAFAGALSDSASRSGKAVAARDIDAISVAGQQHGMVVLDKSGNALLPAKLWNDTEYAPDAADLRVRLGDGDYGWAKACGSVPVAALTISKLAWLKRSEPHSFSRMAMVLLPHDWLTYRLTGRFCTDRGDASGTGYWSPSEERWRFDLLSLVDPDVDWEAKVPEVLGPVEAAGDWDGITVGPGTGDNMASALGVGLAPGDTAISLGTSGTAFTVSDVPACDPSGYASGFADASGRFLPLVCTLNATRVTDTVGTLLSLDRDTMSDMALNEPLGAGGLVVVPYFDGERTPNRPYARGAVVGLSTRASISKLVRASFEGVVCSILDARDHLGEHDGSLFLVGGGSRLSAYQQIVADLADEEVTISREQETVAAGACVQAASVATASRASQVIEAWGLRQGTRVSPSERASGERTPSDRASVQGVSPREVREGYRRVAESGVWDAQR
ncbi:MAG: xylulokinase [Acidimicrobiales bacterium]